MPVVPGVPYTVEIRAYTHAGGGLAEKMVVFTKEVGMTRSFGLKKTFM